MLVTVHLLFHFVSFIVLSVPFFDEFECLVIDVQGTLDFDFFIPSFVLFDFFLIGSLQSLDVLQVVSFYFLQCLFIVLAQTLPFLEVAEITQVKFCLSYFSFENTKFPFICDLKIVSLFFPIFNHLLDVGIEIKLESVDPEREI